MKLNGILLLDESPHMFKSMSLFLAEKGFILFTPTHLNEATSLIQDEKIDLIIYSMGAKNEFGGLYKTLIQYYQHLPSICLDPKQEYTDPTNVFLSQHLVLRHLGPKEVFLNIIKRLTTTQSLLHSKQRFRECREKLQELQSIIIGKSKADSYKRVLEFLSFELKAEKGACWYYQAQGDHRAFTSDLSSDIKIILHRETTNKDILTLAKQYNSSVPIPEKILVNADKIIFPILNKDKSANIVFFSLDKSKILAAQNTEFINYLYAELCHLIRMQESIYEIEELSFVDDVTGLFNQRYLHLVLDQEIEHVKRNNTKFAVLFIDIDHFKNVNDKNGHLVGSQILKEIGKILKSNVRSVDYCFRYGGDEFILVLSETNTQQASIVAERIRKQIEVTDFVIDGLKVHVTLSIGIACFPDHAKTKKKIIQVADEAMYCAKNLTRNIVYVAS